MLEVIDNASINGMIIDVYKDINNELKRYAKKMILEAMGITIDSWGDVTSVSESLKDEILNIEDVQKLRNNLIETVKADVILKLNAEMESKYYSKKAVTQIASSIFTKLNKQIISEIEATVHDELLTSYSEAVKSSVYAIPQIQEIMIKKL